eukprot:gene29408-3991_t
MTVQAAVCMAWEDEDKEVDIDDLRALTGAELDEAASPFLDERGVKGMKRSSLKANLRRWAGGDSGQSSAAGRDWLFGSLFDAKVAAGSSSFFAVPRQQ